MDMLTAVLVRNVAKSASYHGYISVSCPEQSYMHRVSFSVIEVYCSISTAFELGE